MTPTIDEFVGEARQFLGAVTRKQGGSTPDAAAKSRYALFSGSTDAELTAAVDYQRAAFDAGFGWITGPSDLGGSGLSGAYERAFAAVEREFPIPSKGPLSVSLGMVAPTLAQFGSPEATVKWLTGLRRADIIGCQLFSELAAGSDLAAVRTRAVQDEGSGEWTLNGQKVWTSGAHYSDIGIALTCTSDGPRHKNMTAFVVDMRTPGVDVRPLRQITGAADFNEVFLTDVTLPDWCRLGEVGQGWSVAIAMLMHERNAIGGSSSGGSGLFRMDDLAAWIRDLGRHKDPAVIEAFARVYSGVTSAKAMRRRADANLKANGVPGPEMSLGKLALTANLQALSDLVTTVLGPRLIADIGVPRTYAWSEFVLSVPGMRIGGGTDEIHRNTVAERFLGLPKDKPART
ncbi:MULTISPECIES: acyl-CoA dehydrogenase family protein [Gordonia]|jgi:alkylation response protein AidB-like acyl-CoA dehydrogenase|uniref:Putative acyl-CoA dehydrogenase n=1 Tax=Gordonia alkanivorans NBRC 16433 TaxID=1027371 RepID=F9VPM8_9ACTN|nr:MULTISPECIES: acyl-CoA dehydrogenase family protein [Gordonia]MDH3008422.1 acyl-CoA dehydrogenase family protein [Gordonia alkanivorans]MDH3020382.1 acyl-CoA dehydrogenase family protein [Gordonia alkanivorans]MDH3026664.1 acyl-CoA dehydrogenase family protein [Gordonia alkanivorans]MDH3044625.1 acyl-CoA dehydrogenase family protein [Gordonia alkanivorans]MDH3048996.1 acyl-CoA dehydrogenase family protein [Gordonia alkanivorans]